MITQENPSMSSRAESIYMSNSDENIRELCRRREDAIAHENFQKKKIKELTEKADFLSSENRILTSENASLNSEIARLRKLLEENYIQDK